VGFVGVGRAWALPTPSKGPRYPLDTPSMPPRKYDQGKTKGRPKKD